MPIIVTSIEVFLTITIWWVVVTQIIIPLFVSDLVFFWAFKKKTSPQPTPTLSTETQQAETQQATL